MSNENQNIVLIGFRGTGKSTVAKLLAKKLNRTLYSTDNIIEEKEHEKIASIINTKGWEYFRDMESKVLQNLDGEENVIIDCGGGIILREENRKLLQQPNNLIILLEADSVTIEQRISRSVKRVRFTPKKTLTQEIATALEERNSFYHSLAELKFNSSSESTKSIAEKIISLLR